MTTNSSVSQVRGMRDLLNDEYQSHLEISRQLRDTFRQYGYFPIDTPIIEHTELYFRKSGEEIGTRMFEFDFKGRRISLRPDFSASVMRAYVDNLQNEPLPLRLQYQGPVFRYEKPQHNRYRQFTVAGVEFIGEGAPMADAEVMYLACRSLQEIGITDYRLVISHVDVLNSFLTQSGIRRQLSNFLIRNMENVRKRGIDHVRERLIQLYPDLADTDSDDSNALSREDSENHSRKLLDLLRNIDEEDAQRTITHFLHSLNIRIETNRGEKDVINRLLAKIREEDQEPRLREALAFMQELSELVGSPDEILPKLSAVLDRYDATRDALHQLEAIMAAFDQFADISGTVEIDFGMNRGLQFYTGFVFEIHHAQESDTQLCGGGRYDNLISLIGGTDTPAVGFSFGVDRLVNALRDENDPARPVAHSDIIIVPIELDDYAYAIQVGDRLRADGYRVELSMPGRSLRSRLRYVDKASIPVSIIIGKDERTDEAFVVRNMISGDEQTASLNELSAVVKEAMKL